MEQLINRKGQDYWRESLCLWAIAVAVSSISIALTHFPPVGLAYQLLIPFHSDSEMLMLVAVIAQNAVHLAIFIGVGLLAAHRLGLGAPVLEAWLRGEDIGPHLRPPIVPILLTVFLLMFCSALANSSVFHPNREQDTSAANELLHSPSAENVIKQIDNLGLASTKPYTPVSLTISYLAGAIDSQLDAQLFEVSVIALLFVQIFGFPEPGNIHKFFYAAILIVALIHTALFIVVQHKNTLMYSSALKGIGVQLGADPTWLIVARTSVLMIPASIAFGLLYVLYGIESSVIASFATSSISYLFLTFRFTHLN